MKEWCLKYPGYLIGIILIICWSITDIVSTIKGNPPKPIICFGQCGDA